MKKKLRSPRFWILTLLAAVTAALLAAWLWPYWLMLMKYMQSDAFKEMIVSLGWAGWIVMFLFQMLQVIVAFIPGGPVQLAAGAVFGPWQGLLVSVLGITAGSIVCFFISRRLGAKAVQRMVSQKDMKLLELFKNSKKLEWITFLLFLVPGAPKDTLAYLSGLTPIRFTRFILISTAARFPALAASCFSGDALLNRNWKTLTLIIVLVALFCIVGLYVNRWIAKQHQGAVQPDDRMENKE